MWDTRLSTVTRPRTRKLSAPEPGPTIHQEKQNQNCLKTELNPKGRMVPSHDSKRRYVRLLNYSLGGVNLHKCLSSILGWDQNNNTNQQSLTGASNCVNCHQFSFLCYLIPKFQDAATGLLVSQTQFVVWPVERALRKSKFGRSRYRVQIVQLLGITGSCSV